MSRRFRLSALGAALLCVGSQALAAPVVLTSSSGGYLGAGSHVGVFDGSGVLPSSFHINSASFAFLFSDDQDAVSTGATQSTGSSVGSYSLINSYYNGNYNYTYLRTVTAYQQVERTGEAESASVSFAGIGVGSGSTAMSQSSTTGTAYNGQSFDSQSGYNGYGYSCGNRCSGWAPGSWSYYYSDNYTQTTTQTTDWSGDFAISGMLSDLSLLDSLLIGGVLQYELLVSGDLRLTGATLTLDISDLNSEPSSSVPEPTSLALLAVALGGLAYSSRRRKPRTEA